VIPFELHITINDLPANRTNQFVNSCAEQEAKPMLIELSRGQHLHQPMMNKVVYAHSLEHALQHARNLCETLQQQAFGIKRIKIEVPASEAHHDFDLAPGFQPYFEWHGKVTYERANNLLDLCTIHQVHLSLNALKKEQLTRFVTLREFGNIATFEHRVQQLILALEAGLWPVVKQQAEYCVYDNNVLLDNGWLVL
jgi:hypothetical protein